MKQFASLMRGAERESSNNEKEKKMSEQNGVERREKGGWLLRK